jgi:hypothetical protein
MGWMTEDLGFSSQQVEGTYLFPKASRVAVEPTQPPPEWAMVYLSWR